MSSEWIMHTSIMLLYTSWYWPLRQLLSSTVAAASGALSWSGSLHTPQHGPFSCSRLHVQSSGQRRMDAVQSQNADTLGCFSCRWCCLSSYWQDPRIHLLLCQCIHFHFLLKEPSDLPVCDLPQWSTCGPDYTLGGCALVPVHYVVLANLRMFLGDDGSDPCRKAKATYRTLPTIDHCDGDDDVNV